jgi:hypothetical protein
MQKDATTGKWTYKTHLTADQDLAQKVFVLDQWYKQEGVKLDKANLALDQQKQKFYEWATKSGLTIDQKQLDLAWATLTENKRHDLATEAISAAGGAGGTNENVYDPSDDRALVNSTNFQASGPGSAPYLRLGAYSGAMTGSDVQFKSFMYGGTTKVVQKQYNADGSPKMVGTKQVIQEVDQTFTGLMELNEAEAQEVIRLIKDPVRAGEAWAMYCALNDTTVSPTAVFRTWAADNGFTPSQLAAGLAALKKMGINTSRSGE